MTKQSVNKAIIYLISGFLVSAFTYYFLNLIPFYPQVSRLYLAGIEGLLWIINPILGVVSALAIFIIPITYTSLTLTLIFLMFYFIVAIFETWAVGPYGFLVMAATIVIVLHPELHFLILTVPLLAGFMGAKRGAFLSAFSCFLGISLSLIMGKTHLGLVNIWGSAEPLVKINPEPVGKLFGSGWLMKQVSTELVDKELFHSVLSPFGDHLGMLVQIALWALAAGLLGYFLYKPLIKKIPACTSAILIGVITLAIGFMLLPRVFTEVSWQKDQFWLAILIPMVIAVISSPGLLKIAKVLTPSKHISMEDPESQFSNLLESNVQERRQKAISKVVNTQFEKQNIRIGSQNDAMSARGILLFGPPRTEKLQLAKKIADEAKATLISVTRDDLSAKYHDVFVSYSTRDKAVTDKCVELLEQNNIQCWYAPRDIKPGADWGKEVTNAINSSKMILLIFSGNSNHSQRVQDEINFAISKEMPILPFRIENVSPNDALLLHLSSRHWLDAYSPSWKEYLDELKKLVLKTLDNSIKKKDTSNCQNEVEIKDHLKQVFSEAQAHRPSVLFFEELSDFVCSSDNQTESPSGTDTTETFLECIDQLANNPGILVLAATEYPEKIDETILESGRLAHQFYLSPPDRNTCRTILAKYLSSKPIALNVDFNKLAGLMEGYALADVEAIAIEAADLAESTRGTKQKPIGMVDIEKVIKTCKPIYSADSLVKYEKFAAEHGCILEKQKDSQNKKRLFSMSPN